MKLAQTILSKLRRSDLFVENRPAQAAQLRRSGIFRRRADVAPTELENLLIASATNIPLLRSCGFARRDSLKIARRFNAGNGLACASSPAGTAEPVRPFRSSLRDS